MFRKTLRSTGQLLHSGALALALCTRFGAVVAVLLVGLYYTVAVLMKLTQDTTSITNSAFAIFATLAALSFSWSRAAGSSPDVKDRITHAGERFLHSAVSVLTASLLKYAALSAGIAGKDLSPLTASGVSGFLVGLAVVGLFLDALLFGHTGLVVLNRLLWGRAYQYPEYDSFA